MSIYSNLFTFQRNIVDSIKDKDAYGLFLDMGLGKTPTSLALAEANDCTKVLIITINSKAIEDVSKFGSWLFWSSKSDIPYRLISKSDTPEFDNSKPEVYLINYEQLFIKERGKSSVQLRQNIINFIHACGEHNVAIIVDESHKIKNLQSKQTKAIEMIKRLLKFRAKKVYTYLLTGTPFTTGYVDLYSQLKMLGYPETKTTFVDRFAVKGHVPGLLGWQQPIVGYKNINELFDEVHKYAITIKSDLVADLPEQIFVKHSVSQSEEFTMFTKEYAKGNEIANLCDKLKVPVPYSDNKRHPNPFFRNIAYPDVKWLAETTGTNYLRCRQLSIGFQGNSEDSIWYDTRRLAQVKQFLEDNPDNYLIFYNYTPEMIELYNICEELGYNIDVFCGEIKSTVFYDKYEKQTEEQQFMNKRNALIANFASGSTGMNWQAYNKCIIFSLPIYSHYEQAIKRIHRLGQTKTTFYHVFYQDNWLDNSMQKALDERVEYSEKMFQSDITRIKQSISDDTSQ